MISVNDCWIGDGYSDKDGYKYIKRNGIRYRLHRFSYETLVGPIPAGKYVLHKCDNPPCFNPSHLYIGDAKTNYADSANKGRNSRGERSGSSKLTERDVIAIRGDTRTQVEIAASYGIRQTTVSEIKLRNRWRHI